MSRKKIILLLSVFLLLGITFTNSSVRGHTPSKINVSYDFDSRELTVVIKHSVIYPEAHYIERVRIWVNYSLVKTVLYRSQTSDVEFRETYHIIAKVGDKLQVCADCNFGGTICIMMSLGLPNGIDKVIRTTIISIIVIILLIISTAVIIHAILKKQKVRLTSTKNHLTSNLLSDTIFFFKEKY